MNETAPGSPDPLHRRVAQARLVLGFERYWPVAVALAVLGALFLAASWFGVWIAMPRWARVAGLAGFALVLASIAAAALRIRRPDRDAALARLDRDSGLLHRPVSSGEDRLSGGDADPATRALWEAHRRRIAEAAARVRVAPPSPRLVDRDPFALRIAAVLALATAAFVAGADKAGRLAAAFDWRGSALAEAGFRLDSWVDPPAYTGQPPMMLSAADANPRDIPVPVNSVIVTRAAGAVEIASDGGVKPVAPDAAAEKPKGAGAERRFTLAGDGRLTIERDGAPLASYAFHAIPDRPPTIALTEPPVRNGRGSLTLSYAIDDDYGVVGAEAAFADPVLHGKPVSGRTLVEPPKVTLGLPAAPHGLGRAQTTADVADSPWAGAEATMTLSARDEGGNVGTSPPVKTTLPARRFTQPLARALVEQRRDLVLDPDHRAGVSMALDALLIAPDLFDTTPALFLGLDAARKRLAAAKGDPDLLAVADLLWSMALQIEDGDLSQTEKDLRALQQQLKDALARGAPPEEIAKLTQALRQQLDKFLAELAEKAARSPDGQPDAQAGRSVTSRDLQAMLDRMERSARAGDTADARRMLEDLQNLLENLQAGRPGQGQQGTREMNRSMSALDKMMRDQQALRDRTFKRGRGGPPEGDPGQEGGPSPEQGQDPGQDGQEGDLQGQQQALRQQLEELQRRMRQLGAKGEEGLAEAEQAMRDAEGALGQGQAGAGRAVDAQGRALQGLQKGQQGLASQMAQEQGDQGEGGTGQPDGIGEQTGSRTDPLGRARDGRGSSGRDLELGQGLAARAQQVLEELRRRLADPARPQEEQDYLERLLRRY